jgi:hypothetical protein
LQTDFYYTKKKPSPDFTNSDKLEFTMSREGFLKANYTVLYMPEIKTECRRQNLLLVPLGLMRRLVVHFEA